MTRASVLPFRRMTLWTTLLCLVILAFTIAACGDGGSTAAPSSSNSNSNSASSSSNSSSTTSAVTVTIKEQTGGHDIYSFDPKSVTIKAGQAVTFDNQSDEFHLLIASDDMGKPVTPTDPFMANLTVPSSRASSSTTLQVVFKTAGTYHYTSKLVNRPKDKDHPEGAMSEGMGTIIVTQ
jgi:plastocyanin